jgi:hypothetical protein
MTSSSLPQMTKSYITTDEYLKIMAKESLFLKPEKCQFIQRTMEFLGYAIDQGTIQVDPSKSHGLENWNREH